MAIVIENIAESEADSSASSLTLTKPSGVVSGDFLMLMVCTSHSSSSTMLNAVTGWTKQFEYGTTTGDTKIGLYTRVSDGTEGASQAVTWVSSAFSVGWYVRLSGVDNSDPIWGIGTHSKVESASSINPTGLYTLSNGALAFNFVVFDGADGLTALYCSTGQGWNGDSSVIPTNQEMRNSSGNSPRVRGAWVTKPMPSGGDTSYVITYNNISDGWTAVQFALNEGEGGGGATRRIFNI